MEVKRGVVNGWVVENDYVLQVSLAHLSLSARLLFVPHCLNK